MMVRVLGDSLDGLKGAPFQIYRTSNKTCVSLQILCLNVQKKREMSEKKGVSHSVTLPLSLSLSLLD